MTRLAEILTGIPSQAQPAAPASKVTPAAPRRSSSGISTHARSAAPRAVGADEAEMYTMPLEELRERANKQLRD